MGAQWAYKLEFPISLLFFVLGHVVFPNAIMDNVAFPGVSFPEDTCPSPFRTLGRMFSGVYSVLSVVLLCLKSSGSNLLDSSPDKRTCFTKTPVCFTWGWTHGLRPVIRCWVCSVRSRTPGMTGCPSATGCCRLRPVSAPGLAGAGLRSG